MASTLKITSCNNIRFKGQFVLDNLEKLRKVYSFKSGTLKLIQIARRDGLKCDCCSAEVEFRIHPQFGVIMYSPKGIRFTMDHDLLNSLEGSNALDNQHLLCFKCNQLRGNLFAEYKEFKDWVHDIGSRKLNPQSEINKVERNFSYIDLEKNGYTKDKLLTIAKHYATNFMSEEVFNNLVQHYIKHQSFKNVKGFYDYRTMISFTNSAWDNFINQFLVVLIKQRQGVDIPTPCKQYGLIGKKAFLDYSNFLGCLNHIIKTEYEILKRPIYNKKKATSKVIAGNETKVQGSVLPVRLTFWKSFTSGLRNIFA